MDQILTIPADRKPQSQMLLCSLMAVTLLLLLTSVSGQQRTVRPAEAASTATAPILVASN